MPDGDIPNFDDWTPPPKPRISRPLDLISKYESGDANIPNYRFDKGHTAQGYYQITNTNWRNIGPQVGVDLNQHPSAMSAPRDVQAKVAGEMYRRRGFADWAPFNPRLAAAIQRGESGEPQQPAKIPDFDTWSQQPATPPPARTLRPMRRQSAPKQPVSRFAGAQVGGEVT